MNLTIRVEARVGANADERTDNWIPISSHAKILNPVYLVPPMLSCDRGKAVLTPD